MATAALSRTPVPARWRTEQLLFRDATSAVGLFCTYLLYSGQLWQQLCSTSEGGAAAPVQDVSTSHPPSRQIWQLMCWAGTQATASSSYPPGCLKQAWIFIKRAVYAYLLAGPATQDLMHTVLPLLRLAMLLLFARPSSRHALLARPHWRSIHHMAQRLLPLAAALHGVLGREVASSSLQHALPCWLEWCLPVFLGWMAFMLELPTRLQLATGILEWLLYSATALAVAVRMQEVQPSGLNLVALVAWPFLMLCALPTVGVALHSRSLEEQYRRLQQQHCPSTGRAACSGTCSGGKEVSRQGGCSSQSGELKGTLAVLRRCGSAPGWLGIRPLKDPPSSSTASGGGGGMSAAQTPQAAAAASMNPAASAAPLVSPRDASSASDQLAGAAASCPTLAACPTSKAADKGASSSNRGSLHGARRCTPIAPGAIAPAIPHSAAVAGAAAAAQLAVAAPMVEAPPPDAAVHIAAVEEGLRPSLVALLGAELGEQLLAGFNGDMWPAGGSPSYSGVVNLVPVSIKVATDADGAAHDAVADQLTSTVHSLFCDGAGPRFLSRAVPGTGRGSVLSASGSRCISSICIEGCVQLLGSMYAFKGPSEDNSTTAADGASAGGTDNSSSGGAAGGSSVSNSGSQPGAIGAVPDVQPDSSPAKWLLTKVLRNLHPTPATATGVCSDGPHVTTTCNAPSEAPAVAVWLGHDAAGIPRPSSGTEQGELLGGVSSSAATHINAVTRLRLVSTYPTCVTAGAASSLRLHLQGPGMEGQDMRRQPRQQHQQQPGVQGEQQQADVAAPEMVRVVAHIKGRPLVDTEMAWAPFVSLELPSLPVGVLDVALVCVTTHQPLVMTPILVLPVAAAEDLEQVCAAHLAAGTADIDSAMAEQNSAGLSDATTRVWMRQMQPLLVDIAALLMATDLEGRDEMMVAASYVSPAAADAPARASKQLQCNHGAVSSTANVGGAVLHLAANLIRFLAYLNAYSLVELLIFRVEALQASSQGAASHVAASHHPVGMAAGVDSGAAGATAPTAVPSGAETAEDADAGSSARCSHASQVLCSSAGGDPLPEPATPPACLERNNLRQLFARSPSSSSSSSSSNSSSSSSTGPDSCPLLLPRLSWQPVRAADALLALQALLLALRVSLEPPEGRSPAVGMAVMMGWHLVLLGPMLGLLVRRHPLVGWRRDALCLGWSAGAAVYMAAAARLGLLPRPLLTRGAASKPWAQACLGLVTQGIWRPLITQVTPSCCILINLLLSLAAVYAHACLGARWAAVCRMLASQVFTAVAGPLVTHWVAEHVLRV